MKPPLASDVLRRNAPRMMLGHTFQHRNRYENLRDISPAPSARMRSESVASQKRKVGDCDDLYTFDSNAAKVCRIEGNEDEEIAKLESKMSKVSTTCGKLITSLQQISVDDSLRALLADLIEAVRMSNEAQEEMHNRYKSKIAALIDANNDRSCGSSMWVSSDFPAPPPPARSDKTVNNVIKRKKPTGGLVSVSADERGKLDGSKPPQQQKPQETEDEKKVRKFQEAIRDAERSTLCFNLDMGNTPIMNRDTITERASLALTKMAANVEGKGRSIPCAETIESLDDITSMVTNMELYGTKTQTYKGKYSTGFCTVPVKYQFKDRDQKAYAEKTLREVCKVKCTTPYPAIVRECIKQVVDHVRKSHPDDYVRVNVVAKEFSLKVSRRPPGKDCPWVDYPDLLRLPDQAMDVATRKVPQGLRMFFLPEESMDEMVTSPCKETPPSGVLPW
jgi:hypothetical protein